MITFIFTLTLAIRWVARVVGAVAALEKVPAGDGLKAVWARTSQFPANSLPDPAAGEMFSLLTWSSNLVPYLDLARNYRAGKAGFGAGTRNFPAVMGI